MLKLAVVGSRGFNNYKLLKYVLDKLKPDVIISGDAVGTDTLARRYAEENNIPFKAYPPDWSIGNNAGFIRNETIWFNSNMGVAFWDGISTGTKHSFEIATKQNKRLFVVEYKNKKVYWSNENEQQLF